jgi:hypothetical protein
MKADRVLALVETARCAVREWTQRLIALLGRRSAASLPNQPRREIFILTLEEKKTVCFVLVVFVLGLAAKYYRDRHPNPLPKPATAARETAVRKPPRASRP